MAITDDFNRASLGSGWEAALLAAWTIANNAAQPVSTFANTATRRAEGNFPADQYAQARCQVVTTFDVARGGVAVRMDSAGNCYYVLLDGATPTLYKRVAGASAVLGSFSFAAVNATYYTLRLTVTGTQLVVTVNGVTKMTVTDAALVSGKPGLFAQTGWSVMPFEDFECSAAVAASGGGGGSLARGSLLGVG